ncbi:protein of unknown function DUF1848 [Solidesulfovibrio carbinoliphilus subsp. oakridgensis]|uniref:DUF1848 domain-containing protein n=1 Tax=Solidesulfovibrio carbinoliphilus subsp. oakridgensis TaxID=694327 RepID=G7Q4G1_9BACT|nr:DUF1848 domain-containing protein [Solidesulfovibrio carbinoliphilus]EHJ47184.1 protein of unknown function DUF1848 [Solidesulfovibrio carbinoliphilus subsp. oakridgensis]
MIISASRRTDIPAFYARWLLTRLRAGFCEVINPFNAAQVSRVSLAPEDVSAIVFWTRDPRPLAPRLPEILSLGHEPFFLMTLLDNPRALDPKGPDAATGLAAFAALAGALPGRVAWRYDPIVLTEKTPADWHRAAFARLAARLAGHTDRVIVSFLEPYRKIAGRLRGLAGEGYGLLPPDADAALALLLDLKDMAASHGMTLSTCCQPEIFQAAGIPASRCIDPAWIERQIGRAVPVAKDPHQRPRCGCAPSKDIGAYDRCLFGCRYCYATTSFARAAANFAAHDSAGASL